MIQTAEFTLGLSECRDTSLVGGKAANLGRLLRAGFPVPDGFVVTTRAWLVGANDYSPVPGCAVHTKDDGKGDRHLLPEWPGGCCAQKVPVPFSVVAEAIRASYRALGGGPVAVRSSATAEDMTGASMAGQYETFLNIEGEQAVLDAVERCWASLEASRVQAYLREHALDPARVAMAVVVQRLVPAQVAGVLFTTNPHDGHHREMLLEAGWGLGEMVVSGRVQPDVLRLERDTGRVLDAVLGDKRICLVASGSEPCSVEGAQRRQSCLRGRDVYRLWQLGRRVAEHFGAPQDIEWALCNGELYLLQSRPITTLGDLEAYEEVLRTTKCHLRAESTAGRGSWVLHNLAETLPHPTPLTWSIIQRFMSGSGGFGAMYRQVGFTPSPALEREGFLECLAGRIYMDTARAPEMLFENFPFAYDLEELKRNPDASQAPPTRPCGSLVSRCQAQRKLAAVRARLKSVSVNLEGELRHDLFPGIGAFVAEAKRTDWRSLSTEQLLEQWERVEREILDVFGPRLLLPGLMAAMTLGELRTFLSETFWDEDAEALAQLLSAGGAPDRTIIADVELCEVAQGQRSLETWLAEHGHRAAGEFDLAQPRWRERPAAVREMADRLAVGEGPRERQHRQAEAVHQKLAELCSRLGRGPRRELHRLVSLVQRHITLREDSKDFLMLGYDLLRDLALEVGRRLELGEDVFFLTRAELFDALRVGFAPYHVIEQRKAAYRAEVRLSLPRVIDAQTIDSLGEIPEATPGAGNHKAPSASSGRGLAISGGEAEGPVRIRHSPTEAGDLGHGYILVCPSTDPSWTPLFVHAAGLVLECGGTLSHGAVVAREMGLPAVVLPDATRLFHEGQEIHIDGRRGWAGPVVGATGTPNAIRSRLGTRPCGCPSGGQARGPAPTIGDDTSVRADLVPPPAGRKDHRGVRWSCILAAVWAVYLVAFFLLPEQYVQQPTLRALDVALWPIVRSVGKPAVVAIIAGAMALLTLLVQKFATDNPRLHAAKRRAAVLRKQARSLEDSPRRTILLRLAAGVQMRTLVAALVPMGMLLGPLVLPFVWFRARIDPASWNAPPGSAVQIVATVDSDWREPTRIEVPSAVTVDESTPVSRTLPPLRETLEHLLTLYCQPLRQARGGAWELQSAPDLGRELTARDLQAYLAGGVPPQGVTWLIRPPGDFNGRFAVQVVAGERPPVRVGIVLGDKDPPGSRWVAGPADSPVREVRVVYPQPKHQAVFWQPFAAWGGRMAALDLGWLWLYLLVYLPTLVVARTMLKVA